MLCDIQHANIHVGHPIPFVDLLADAVKLDVRNTWTPNSTFLKRLKSPQVASIGRDYEFH